jgi:hypothetical protein
MRSLIAHEWDSSRYTDHVPPRSLDLTSPRQLLRLLTLAVCLCALCAFLLRTWTWPFMGDSGYIHYVVFLTRHGFAPYRDIVEINTPGAYLTERLSIALFGVGALGWRLFDLSLLAITFASYFRILRGIPLALSLLAGTLFLAIHGQDGVMMSGERDLTAAVLQIAAIALLLIAANTIAAATTAPHPRPERLPLAFLSGVLLSWSACIKPPNILLLAAVLLWIAFLSASRRRVPLFLSVAAGSLLPCLLCLAYLLRYHALRAYWTNLHTLEAYHVTLDRKPLSYLLSHAFSPVLWLAILALAVAFSRRRAVTAREALLLLAAAAGLLSYILQGKGFSYQRYPFLIFLLPLIALWLTSPLPSALWRDALRACILLAALATICLMVHKAATYSHADPDTALMADLQRLGATNASGSIQCLDTAGSCIQTLYKERLVQSTGFLYDCYFEDPRNPTVRALRSQFEEAIQRKPPEWIVETNSSCFSNPRTFDKYPDWTSFNSYLSDNYALAAARTPTRLVRYWSRPELPFAYRIYRLKQ